MTVQTKIPTVLPQVDWSIIRYANCWEDANFLLNQLQLSPGQRILSIASGGDNSFSLLTTNPENVIAVDINATQLYLVELKKEAIRNFDWQECLAFFGFEVSKERWSQYLSLREKLSVETRTYFDQQQKTIESGIIYAGKLGKFFRMFSNYILPLIHNKKRVAALFEVKTASKQKQFFKEVWNGKRWRSFFKIAFSRELLGKFGRDPEFFNQVDIPVSDFILQQTQYHLQQVTSQKNPFLRFCLTGSFENELPHYMRKENFAVIKSNIDQLKLCHGSVETAVAQHGRFHAFNLSNIFEYLDQATCAEIAHDIIEGRETKGKGCLLEPDGGSKFIPIST